MMDEVYIVGVEGKGKVGMISQNKQGDADYDDIIKDA